MIWLGTLVHRQRFCPEFIHPIHVSRVEGAVEAVIGEQRERWIKHAHAVEPATALPATAVTAGLPTIASGRNVSSSARSSA